MAPRNSSFRLVALTIVVVLTLVYLRSPSMIQIANPASEYCIQQGGTLEIVRDKDGNEMGMCKLPDGTVREEWEFFRSQHQQDETGSSQGGDQVATVGDTQASKQE